MSKYAIIRLKGHQYKVEEGQELLVDKASEIISPEVLLFVDKEDVKIGTPVLKDVVVKTKILKDEEKGKKISVFKYKAKSRYRKKIGFRPLYTRLLIEKIS